MADVLAYFEAYHDIRLLEQTKQEENEMQDENDMGAAYVKVYEKKALLDHMVNYFSQQAEETFLESKPENIEN
jgi:alpha-D-ribose 1-methylphosphonate 5-phosphate C-P lyase